MLFHQRDVHPPFENWYWSFKICCGLWNFWLVENFLPVKNFFTYQEFFGQPRIFFLVENVFCRDNLIGLYAKIDLKSSEKAWKESKINKCDCHNNLNSWHSLSLHQSQVCCKIWKSLHSWLLTSVNSSNAGSNCSLFQTSMHHAC